MFKVPYRPWGELSWVLDHMAGRNWSILGSLGTEERSLATWSHAVSCTKIANTRLLRIEDKPSRHTPLLRTRLATRLLEFKANGGRDEEIQDVGLFCPHSEIVNVVDEFFTTSTGSVILDITSLPKRFFFPAIRRILGTQFSSSIRDIVATYAIPEKYPREPLAENFNDWAHLPLFSVGAQPQRKEMLAIGVGFQALGLHDHLKGEPGLPIKLLLPFPAPTTSFMRSWDLLRQLRQYGDPNMFEVYRAAARDPSDTFDRLVSLSKSGTHRVALAPFGPKPMSLGMCLFACKYDCEVFYTQPSVYHPDYSSGVSTIDGRPEIYGFCIRANGRNFF